MEDREVIVYNLHQLQEVVVFDRGLLVVHLVIIDLQVDL